MPSWNDGFLDKNSRILIFIFCIFVFVLGAIFVTSQIQWIDIAPLISGPMNKPSTVLDCHGKVLFYFSEEKKDFVEFSGIPKCLVEAFLVTEDRKFFTHSGISLKGIIRSIIVNLALRRKAQGASTITQQLARLICVGNKKTFVRKIREMFTAFQLEKMLTKRQIFELYVNNIYFGHGIYGVRAAANRFWGKKLNKISYPQAAALAAVAKSALLFSPLNSVDGATSRRNLILRSLHNAGKIEKEHLESFVKEPINVLGPEEKNKIRSYLYEHVRCWCEKKYGHKALYGGGLVIRTTVDAKTQNAAEMVFARHLKDLRRSLEGLDGGLLSIEPWSGKIRAFVGGLDFSKSQFNRAFQAVRQMGSVFKPIVYTAAVEEGVDLGTELVDEPIEVTLEDGGSWSPKNWDGKFCGTISLKDALARSNNVVTAKLFLMVGAGKVLNVAKRFGLSRQLLPYPSSALGTAEATVQECLCAFNVFASGGMLVKPYFVESVSRENTKLYFERPKVEKVLKPDVVSKMESALSYTINRYGRLKGAVDGIECLGKSGSTNEARTLWFVGACPTLSTAIYIGRDDNKPLGKALTALPTVYPIWRDFYREIFCRNYRV
ncbi:transglycosylase domain-containing protein [Candidatus Dependentiae bacterium]